MSTPANSKTYPKLGLSISSVQITLKNGRIILSECVSVNFSRCRPEQYQRTKYFVINNIKKSSLIAPSIDSKKIRRKPTLPQ